MDVQNPRPELARLGCRFSESLGAPDYLADHRETGLYRAATAGWLAKEGGCPKPYLATSADVPGLIAQGRTVTETLEIARDVARKLIAAQSERAGTLRLTELRETFDYPLVLG